MPSKKPRNSNGVTPKYWYTLRRVKNDGKDKCLADVLQGLCAESENFLTTMMEEHPELEQKVLDSILEQNLKRTGLNFIRQVEQANKTQLREFVHFLFSAVLSDQRPMIMENAIAENNKKKREYVN